MEAMLFREDQRLRQWWIVTLILLAAAGGWWAFIQQVIRGKPVGTNPMSDWGVVVLWLLLGMGLPLALWLIRLETVVMPDRVVMKLKPFTTRELRPGEIAQFSQRTYRPLREYGGWGFRGFGSNRAYSMSGNRGVQLELLNGDRILIGSQRPDELETAIAKICGRGQAPQLASQSADQSG